MVPRSERRLQVLAAGYSLDDKIKRTGVRTPAPREARPVPWKAKQEGGVSGPDSGVHTSKPSVPHSAASVTEQVAHPHEPQFPKL